jgi:hypothetical protein
MREEGEEDKSLEERGVYCIHLYNLMRDLQRGGVGAQLRAFLAATWCPEDHIMGFKSVAFRAVSRTLEAFRAVSRTLKAFCAV